MISRDSTRTADRFAAANSVMPSIASARPTGPGSVRKRWWIATMPPTTRSSTARYTTSLLAK